MKTKVEIPQRVFASDDSKVCVYEIYHKSDRTIYYLRGDQAKNVRQIQLDGFQGLPPGLYLNRKGFGFGKKGTFLLSALQTHIGNGRIVEMVITKKTTKALTVSTTKAKITIPYHDVKNLLVRLGRINE